MTEKDDSILCQRFSRGASLTSTLCLTSVFLLLVLSFGTLSQIKATESHDQLRFVNAQVSAESGIAYARALIRRYLRGLAPAPVHSDYFEDDRVRAFSEFHVYLQETLNGSVATNYGDVPSGLSVLKEGSLSGVQFTLPAISIAPGERSNFTLTFKIYHDAPYEWVIVSTGRHTGSDHEVTRTVHSRYRPVQTRTAADSAAHT